MIKNIIIAAVCLVAVAIIVKGCQDKKELESALITSHSQVKYWKDKHKRSNAEIDVLETSRKYLFAINKGLDDSIRVLKIKPRTVTKIITVTSHTSDTIELENNHYIDRWTEFNLNDSILSYNIRDSLALITHSKKYGFLNLKSKYVTRVVSFNPHTTLTGITSVEIKPTQRRISFGIYSGYGVLFNSGTIRTGFTTGVGFTYRIF